MSQAQLLHIAGTVLSAQSSGALWWEAERLVCVADLHLGKSERLARRGGTLLPPYETIATLARLASEISRLDPATVICLGDSFDDASAHLEPGDEALLRRIMRGRHWIWITGNHDPDATRLGGNTHPDARVGPLTFRHEARLEAESGEISGHYHPKLQVYLKGRRLSRPCFLADPHRVILPAFGTYTGGLGVDHPTLRALFSHPARAILTGEPCVTLPLGTGTCIAR